MPSENVKFALELIRQRSASAIRKAHKKPEYKCRGCKDVFPRKMIHMHHHDYTKPLCVVPMCHRCHYAWHRSKRPKLPSENEADAMRAAYLERQRLREERWRTILQEMGIGLQALSSPHG